LQQYSTQLTQYQNMVQNTLQLPSFQWDQAGTTVQNLLGSINSISQMEAQFGNLNTYLSKFQNMQSYVNSPCITSGGCTAQQWLQLAQSKLNGSVAQKSANDASIQGLAQQQTLLQNDANNLATLQASAQNATGQVQAITAANQLASAQSNQLLQIRALLIAQQNALVTRQQALADQEAQQAAAAAQIRTGGFVASPPSTAWHF